MSAPSAINRELNVAVRLSECKGFTRVGLKGPQAADWLQAQSFDAPALPNSWSRIQDEPQSLIARLGNTEFFLEQRAPAALIGNIAAALASPMDGVYPVLREDREFVLEGREANAVLAQVCNVDFKRMSRRERHVVMTMMIGIAVLVIPQDEAWGDSRSSTSNPVDVTNASNEAREANGGCYRIWCDPSYGDYLWSSLQGVITEMGAVPPEAA